MAILIRFIISDSVIYIFYEARTFVINCEIIDSIIISIFYYDFSANISNYLIVGYFFLAFGFFSYSAY